MADARRAQAGDRTRRAEPDPDHHDVAGDEQAQDRDDGTRIAEDGDRTERWTSNGSDTGKSSPIVERGGRAATIDDASIPTHHERRLGAAPQAPA